MKIHEWPLTMFMMVLCLSVTSLLIVVLIDTTVDPFTSHAKTQGIVFDKSWDWDAGAETAILITIGSEADHHTISFKATDEVCNLEVGHAYQIKYRTTYFKNTLLSYEEIPTTIPCSVEVT